MLQLTLLAPLILAERLLVAWPLFFWYLIFWFWFRTIGPGTPTILNTLPNSLSPMAAAAKRNLREFQGSPRIPKESQGTPRIPREPQGTPRNPKEPRDFFFLSGTGTRDRIRCCHNTENKFLYVLSDVSCSTTDEHEAHQWLKNILICVKHYC